MTLSIEEVKEYRRRYYLEHKDDYKRRHTEYLQSNKELLDKLKVKKPTEELTAKEFKKRIRNQLAYQKRKEKQLQYMENNKETISAKKHEYNKKRKERKDEIKKELNIEDRRKSTIQAENEQERKKIYYQQNREEILKRAKERQLIKKEEINNKRKEEKYLCPLCNTEMRTDSKRRHELTKSHIEKFKLISNI